jgi:hypothetical protein
MAVDGFLSSLSSAVDVAIGRLIQTAESRLRPEGEGTKSHLYTWDLAKTLLDATGLPVPSVERVSAALEVKEDPERTPKGWLVILRRLRNEVVHHGALGRHQPRGVVESPRGSSGWSEPTRLHVPGLGEVDPIPYLSESLAKCRELVASMLSDADAIRSAAP